MGIDIVKRYFRKIDKEIGSFVCQTILTGLSFNELLLYHFEVVAFTCRFLSTEREEFLFGKTNITKHYDL